MQNKEVKTPTYWQDKKVFGELVEAETAYGNKVMIPKRYINGWHTAKLTKDAMEARGLDPLDGLEILEETNPMHYDLELVFYEIYKERN